MKKSTKKSSVQMNGMPSLEKGDVVYVKFMGVFAKVTAVTYRFDPFGRGRRVESTSLDKFNPRTHSRYNDLVSVCAIEDSTFPGRDTGNLQLDSAHLMKADAIFFGSFLHSEIEKLLERVKKIREA
jgi:hypothetical protein